MAAYLLSTRSLLDRLSGKPGYPIYDWLNNQKTDETEVYVSAISIGFAKYSIGGIPDQLERERYSNALDKIVANLRKGAVLPVDKRMAEAWAKVLGVSTRPRGYENGRKGSPEVELSDAELLVITAALSKNLTLVEPAQPYHADFASHGLTVETLGE
jgi:hypothetical protein